MNIYLGNLDIAEIERRSGVDFPQELKVFMSDKQQESASNIAEGKWHCFDMPFMLVCGGRKMAEDIYKHLAPLSKQFKEQLQIGLA